MRQRKLQRAASAILAGVLTLGSAGAASPESLAGQVGDKRYPVRFPMGTTGNCKKAYDAYIAAKGHSAYAQTPLNYTVEGFFCGLALNAPSQKAAQERALESCKSTGKKYKYRTVSNCQVYVSK